MSTVTRLLLADGHWCAPTSLGVEAPNGSTAQRPPSATVV